MTSGRGTYATEVFEGTSSIPSQWLKDRSGEPGVFVITRNSDETNYWTPYPWVGFIDEQVTDPPPAPNRPEHSIGLTEGVRIGRSSSDGVSSAGQVSDRLRARSFDLSSTATLCDGAIYLDGNGGAAGVQQVRLAVYKDNGGVPGALVAVGSEFSVQAGSAAAWYVSSFPSTSLPAGRYWLAEFTGGTSGVTRNHGSAIVANYQSASASYAAGAPAVFPPSTAGSIDMDMFVTVK